MAPTLRVAALALCGWLAVAPDALAQGPDCLGFGDVSAAGIGVATVVAGPRTHFLRAGAPGCPGDAAACRERAYLVPGDEVVLGFGTGAPPGLVCAVYTSPRGVARTGWLPEGAVARKPAGAAAAAGDWLGDWRAGPEQRIAIRRGARPGLLRVEGDATWGAADPERVRRGAVHVGEVSGEAAPAGPILGFVMGESGTLPYEAGDRSVCRIRLRLLGDWLLAEDNMGCGGLNVSFSGAYRRAPRSGGKGGSR